MRLAGWFADRLELSRGGEGQNVRPMEGLRGFAVFLVFLVHYASLVDAWIADTPGLSWFIRALLNVGFTGVDLFFVLSGYLIYGSLIGKAQPFGRFVRRRVERIYPAFLVVFALYVGLSFVFPAQSKIPAGHAEAAWYLLQNVLLLPGIFDIRPMITVAWSLSYEMFFYVTIPLAITALGLRQRGTTWRVAFFSALGAALLAYCGAFGGHAHLALFVAGILLHEVMSGTRMRSPGSGAAFAALMAGLLFPVFSPPGPVAESVKVAVLSAAFFLTCLCCFREPLSPMARAFAWTPLRWLGNMSYSYYLLHGLALKGAFLALSIVLPPAQSQGAAMFWLLLVPMFLFTLLPTGALFLAVERPFSLAPVASRRREPQAGEGRATVPAARSD